MNQIPPTTAADGTMIAGPVAGVGASPCPPDGEPKRHPPGMEDPLQNRFLLTALLAWLFLPAATGLPRMAGGRSAEVLAAFFWLDTALP